MIELKPCPFCGGEAKIFANDGVKVMCMSCHNGTNMLRDICINNCKKFNAFEHVVKAWNRRTSE